MSDASHLGARALVTVGTSVWSRERRNDNDDPIGGVVVNIDEKIDDDGEITRSFEVLNPQIRPGDHRFRRWIKEAEVDPGTIEIPNSGRAWKLIQAIGKHLATVKRPLPSDLELVRAEARLVKECL